MKCPSVDMLVLILLFYVWTSWICGLVSVVLSLEIYQPAFPKSSFYWEMWYPSDLQMLILRLSAAESLGGIWRTSEEMIPKPSPTHRKSDSE